MARAAQAQAQICHDIGQFCLWLVALQELSLPAFRGFPKIGDPKKSTLVK